MLSVKSSLANVAASTQQREACKLCPRKYRLTTVNPCAYPSDVGNTKPTWFSSQKLDGRTTAAARFFYVRTTPLRASFYGWALAGASSDAQVSYRACLLTRPTACPPHLAVDGGPSIKSIGGRSMRHAQTRLDQTTLPNNLTERFPLFSYAGRNAAELWLNGAPMSMGDYRDLRFRTLVGGDALFARDAARRQAFNDAFASEIALSIARNSRAEVRHG